MSYITQASTLSHMKESINRIFSIIRGQFIRFYKYVHFWIVSSIPVLPKLRCRRAPQGPRDPVSNLRLVCCNTFSLSMNILFIQLSLYYHCKVFIFILLDAVRRKGAYLFLHYMKGSSEKTSLGSPGLYTVKNIYVKETELPVGWPVRQYYFPCYMSTANLW